MTLISTSKTTLVSHPPEIIIGRDASFSSYINGAEENSVLKLGSKSTPNDHIFVRKYESNDKELDVFRAERYFNEPDHSPKPVLAQNPPTHHPKKDKSPLEIFDIKPQPAKATSTPSIRSESSWNSRSSLLQTVPKDQQSKQTNKKSFFARISCNCSCTNNNSVDVDEGIDENKTDRFVTGYGSVKPTEPEQLKIKREAHLTFPVFNPKPAEKIKTGVEMFGGPESGKMGSGLEKNLAMMTWDAIIAPEEIKTIPSISDDMLGGDGGESDASDASSDLFEIESLTRGGAHNSPFQAATTTCYAPSEASVEWSVVTASAADFEELSGSSSNSNPTRRKFGSIKEMPRLRSGLLSGCMSEKAIRVGGDENGFGGGGSNLRTESFTAATTRFRDEARFDVRNRQRSSFDAPALSRRQSGNAAQLLYT